ncbi:MAG: amino acid adenylation domain-containing protein [bacterium]|nr:amino acid adenylation domain-containing protein [bacterium]
MKKDSEQKPNQYNADSSDIAIIGISCRVPGAENYSEFWQNLDKGINSISEIDESRMKLDSFFSPDYSDPNKSHSKWGGFLKNIDAFDNKFFQISPAEAKNMDPQQRILLEETWKCIEDAGISQNSLSASRTDVYIGFMATDYKQLSVDDSFEVNQYSCSGSYSSILANRISFYFGLTGFSKAIDTACSASMAAIYDAVNTLQTQNSDYAFVGGVNMILHPYKYISFSKARMLSPDGQCKTFDKDANGYVPGEGVAVILLQPLKKALDEKNNIYGVIKGSAVNHVGRARHLSAPTVKSQKELLLSAFNNANIDPGKLSYIEAHGTGTSLGDPIEIEALSTAFREHTEKKQFCKIGSAKSNIGHLEGAAGIAGVIKVLMMMKNRHIPASLNISNYNPLINWESTPFVIATEGADWTSDEPLLAGVSSFGFGGVNGHVVLESFQYPVETEETNGISLPFILSAKSAFSLEQVIKRWKAFVNSDEFSRMKLKDICGTLTHGRTPLKFRIAGVVSSKEDIKSILHETDLPVQGSTLKKTALLIGQYTDRDISVSSLCSRFPFLNDYITPILDVIEKHTGKREICNTNDSLNEFIGLYITSQLLLSPGLEPDLVAGHGTGALVSYALSGALPVEQVVDSFFNKEPGSSLEPVRPLVPLLNPITGEIEYPHKFDAEYVESLISESKVDAATYEEYFKKARTLFESQFTFKNYLLKWNRALQQVDLSAEKLFRENGNENKSAYKLLLMVMIFSALRLLYEKWDLEEHFPENKTPFYDLVNLIVDEVITNDEFVAVLAARVPDYGKIAGSMNTRQKKIKHPYQAPDRLNKLGSINNAGRWIDVNPELLKSYTVIQTGSTNPGIQNSVQIEIDENINPGLLKSMVNLWLLGADIQWDKIISDGSFYKKPLPVYQFNRGAFWLEKAKNLEGKKNMEKITDSNEIDEMKKMNNHGETQDMKIELIKELKSEIIAELKAELKAGLKENIKEDSIEIKTEITRQNEAEAETTIECHPLSAGQKDLWMIYKISPENYAYNVSNIFRVNDKLNIEALRKAYKQLILRHPVLRTRFIELNNTPVQEINPEAKLFFQHKEIATKTEDDLIDFLKPLAREPFNLEEGPLVRLHVFTDSSLPNSSNIILITFHHIIYDGTSILTLVEDMRSYYLAEVRGKTPPLPPLETTYEDFVTWQEDMLSSAEGKKHKDYWLNKLSGELPVLELPTDNPASKARDYIGETFISEISEEETNQLKKLAWSEKVFLYPLMLSAYTILLHRYSGQDDILVGSPVSGRPGKKFNKLMGFFVNMVVLRMNCNDNMTFREFLRQVQNTVSEALTHGDYPLHELTKDLKGSRDSGLLFDAAFLFQNYITGSNIEKSGIELDFRLHQNGYFNFNLEIIEHDNKCLLFFKYNSDLYGQETIARISDQYKEILNSIKLNVEQKISEINLIPASEKEKLLFHFNNNSLTYPKNKTMNELFQEQAEKTPTNTALVYENTQLSYRELNEKANQAGHELRNRGVKADTVVGIMLDRSVEMITGILSIIKAGGAYLPIPVDYPEDRISYLVENSGLSIILSNGNIKNMLDASLRNEKVDIIDIKDPSLYQNPKTNPEIVTMPENLAYVIYTSGSTGKPKGVMVEQQNVVNLVFGLHERIYKKYHENLNVALVAPYFFDPSVQQIFAALLLGHALHVVPEESRIEGDSLLRYLKKHKIEISDGTPIHIQLLQESMTRSNTTCNVKHFIIGGEALHRDVVERFFNNYQENNPVITNIYGPTECCVDSTSYEVTINTIDDYSNIPIGKPMPNEQVYILDKNKQLTPLGVPGELHISGDGVSRGYLNKPELTKASFIDDPFNKERRMYSTGDRVRWTPDGNIEFLERIDHQVKIRGFRIELGEIEKTLYDFERHTDYMDNVDPEMLPTKLANLKRCTKCLISENYPGVEFDEDGVCNFCHEFEEYETHAQAYFQNIDDLKALIGGAQKAKKNDSEYDCLLLFSGGKDSSYVLYRLVELGLKVLAFTFDNGYISDMAFENIERITSKLGVDSVISDAKKMNDIFVESLNLDQTVCNGCFKALTTIGMEVALEKNINMIFTGLSRGQIFDTKLHGLLKQKTYDIKEIEEKLLLFRKLYHSTGDRIVELLDVEFENDTMDNIHFIDFFRYENVSVNAVKEYLKKTDEYWNQPLDTGFCSTNCIINDVGIYVHSRDLEYHNYEGPLSWDIRLGVSTREGVIDEVGFHSEIDRVGTILDEIGYLTPPIKDVVVIDREDNNGSKSLCAYFTSDKEVTTLKLREYLLQKLPDYMVPNYFVQVDTIPMTQNGKVDRKALPDPKDFAINKGSEYISPRNETEKQLAHIWSEVLGVEGIGIDDNFFEMGGDSILAIKVIQKINSGFNIEVPISAIMRNSTIRGLAELSDFEGSVVPIVDTEQDKSSKKAEMDKYEMILIKRGEGEGEPKNCFFIHTGFGNVTPYLLLSEKLDPEITCWGFLADKEYIAYNRIIFENIAETYIKKIREKQPKGPYNISGYCLAATIAFEIARQLEAAGEEVSNLVLISAGAPQKDFWSTQNIFDKMSSLLKDLKADKISLEYAIENMPYSITVGFPDIEKIDKEIFIKELMFIENIQNGRENYFPKTKLKTEPFYIKAEERDFNESHWLHFCKNGIKFQSFEGNHESIFQEPIVDKIASVVGPMLTAKS